MDGQITSTRKRLISEPYKSGWRLICIFSQNSRPFNLPFTDVINNFVRLSHGDLDLLFQTSVKFSRQYFGSSYAIISQTMTYDKVTFALTRKSYKGYRFAYLHLTSTHSKGKDLEMTQ